ncbi:hypothetical protein HPB51_021087 [Rhipicephalus microplus]|uniref:Uncharacterized protein n=1 Tax=Rhipicephalus microplus TaxID=6941 RepID=A0A9J6DCD4_RHIMP|nr:hypothetical protein HPB51_021087 [Rhipicephalus microplus]
MSGGTMMLGCAPVLVEGDLERARDFSTPVSPSLGNPELPAASEAPRVAAAAMPVPATTHAAHNVTRLNHKKVHLFLLGSPTKLFQTRAVP